MQPIVLSRHLALPADPRSLFIPQQNKTPFCRKRVTGHYDALRIHKSSFLPKSRMMNAWKRNRPRQPVVSTWFSEKADSLIETFAVVGEFGHVFAHKMAGSSGTQILRITLSGVASYVCNCQHGSNLSFHRLSLTFLCFSWNPHRSFPYAFIFSSPFF